MRRTIKRVDERKYLYDVGDFTEKGMIVLDKILIKNSRGEMEKGYTVKCLNDGYEYDIRESNSKRYGCPVCYNRKVISGINDISTTRPDLVRYFYNINDAYRYTQFSLKSVKFICPDCGMIKLKKISDVSVDGFSCNRCGDGISYPNKFMFNVLTQLKIEFETEYSPEWIKPKRYDFYIPSKNLIIEMDGGFHYSDNRITDCSIDVCLENDSRKDFMANQHGISVIRIDCNYASRKRFEHICNNVIESLCSYFDFANIDFDDIDKKSSSSILILSSKMYNEGKSKKEISNKLGVSIGTIHDYLTRAKIIGLCDYKNMHEIRGCKQNGFNKSKTIVNLTDGAIYESLSALSETSMEIYGVKLTSSGISISIKENRKYKGFMFKYLV